jgi:hypothetical protein
MSTQQNILGLLASQCLQDQEYASTHYLQSRIIFENKTIIHFLNTAGIIDSSANTTGLGGNAWIVEHITGRTVRVTAYNNELLMDNQTDLPDDTTILLKSHESTDFGPNANLLFAPLQMSDNGIIVHDIPTTHGDKQCTIIEDIVIPFILQEGMLSIKF